MMFDKITSRLNILMEEAQITDIDAVSITQLLVQRMISGISTEQIDELACQIIMGKIHEGQKYGKLASRLAISNYHKTTSSSFKEVIRILRNNKDPCGEIAPLVSEELETFSIKYENIIEDMEQGMGLGRVTAARLGDASGTNGFGANGGYGAGDYSAGGYGAGWRRMAARRAEPADGNWEPANNKTEFTIGDRVFHQKFGYGKVMAIDGDKLDIAFEKAGAKKVMDSFVTPA